jgi:hypothetical protein
MGALAAAPAGAWLLAAAALMTGIAPALSMACLYLSAVALSQSRLTSWFLPLKSLSRVASSALNSLAILAFTLASS